jgi:hypothetical protein
MQTVEVDQARDGRLRFLFNDAVVSFCLAADVTFGEVAQRLSQLPRRRYGSPVAIDVTLRSGRDGSAPGMPCQPGLESHA